MILGIHASVRRGLAAAAEEAAGLGCASMQMFSYRRHQEPREEDFEAFRKARSAGSVRRLLIHVRYVPFLGSADEARRRHSVELLARELRLAACLGAEGLILHAGAYAPGEGREAGLMRIADAVFTAWSQARVDVPLLLENVPGGGRRLGGTLEELAELGENLERRSVALGYALDTAHAWAQGYDLASSEGMWRFLGLAHRLLGADRIRAFHLNDTRALLGSHREHHGRWGEGYLDLEGLRHLLEREEFKDIVGILETPPPYGEDLEKVRALLSSGAA